MIIVCGHLLVDADDRGDYLDGCREVVARGRAAEGCLDFALSPDLLVPGRINILERWTSRAALDAFRGSGTPDDQQSRIRAASVAEYDVAGQTLL
ncbi:putative quinol monooxygenase [Nocardioides euryhalodurans]|uniref:Antibiotic biosynthesis monooxygenase n=1 Tax=Nocardioides euryhalodurans TaxID=2518370 RepID=A0A4P7GJD0_9ACTN|nr:antibiotic biosynthesis monooxygenase [Nocardioides euryhalodurans]QBR92085.1 antibiotic biosynthesis monooxygenase [Nocardioides euryhalodurans]